jgi:hypothetical protein
MKAPLQYPGWIFTFCALLWARTAVPAQDSDVLTYHNDNGRTGQYLNEQILTPGNVNPSQFGKLWVLQTDGKVMAQPLYAAGVSIPGKGIRNVVFIMTEHDSVYAFDADSTNVLWQVSMLGDGEETVSNWMWCSFGPEIGITATPVIDRQLGAAGTIFVEAMSMTPSGMYFHRLHALDLATGADRVPPVEISGVYPGQGDNSDGVNVFFDPQMYIERACLLLLNGVVYTAWSAHCDTRPATSWVMGFDEHTLTQTSVLNLMPNGGLGSIWNSGGGPAADPAGNIYVTLGNGDFDTSPDANGFPSNGNFGGAFVKLSTISNHLAVADYFAMYNIQDENGQDLDLASGSALVLPTMTDAQNNTRQLVVTSGKDEAIYLADRANMGKFNPDNNDNLYQQVTNALPGGTWSMAAYFNGTLYFGPVRSPIMAFPFENARLSTTSSQSPTSFGYPGATPSISASGASNGIVWAAQTVGIVIEDQTASRNAVLHAYAATNLANELYFSNQVTNRDTFGKGNKYITPMIASARVYVGTTTGVGVFGLLDQSALTPLQQWRDNHFGNPSDVGAGANVASPAGDGVPNLIKYALGLDPFKAVTNSLVTPGTRQEGGQTYLTLRVNRAGSPPDVGFRAEVSSDLKTWISGPSYTTTLTNTAAQILIRDDAPIGSSTNGYLRVIFFPVNPL